MGTFFYPITVVGPADRVTVEALVATGATFTSLPGSVLRELGIEPTRLARMRLTDGSVREEPLGEAEVAVDEVRTTGPILFGEEDAPPAMGAITLESLLLGVDLVEQRLVPVIGWQL